MGKLDYESVLSDLGLSPNESAIYEFLLKSGPTPASEIAKETAIKRTNTYHILDHLESKSLIEKSTSGSKTLFSAEHPRALVRQIDQQENKLLNVRQHVHSVMESLTDTYARAMNKPGVVSFCGTQDYTELQKECGKNNESVISLLDPSSALSLLGPSYENSIQLRLTRTSNVKILAVSEFPARIKDLLRPQSILIQHLPLDKQLPFGMEFTCSESSCILTSFEKSRVAGIFIDDPAISSTLMLMLSVLGNALAE